MLVTLLATMSVTVNY